uniref:Vacuolar protein sorting-associated protein 26 n=1 Tax=Compsopogon caeruleus TaxID=31354 RepID=A0A6T6CKI1_9RHOD|mmetsp:Transcript_2987/g.5723  ORF Transcript_2987/g.5723 Transcript_2987/m.5723 type:complete len:198 (+) Transcript_2987:341-934(+)
MTVISVDGTGRKVQIEVKEGKTIQHLGIRVEFIGSIEMLYDRENSQEFTSLVRELEDPGALSGLRRFPFVFTDVEKSYESYSGINVRLRYFVRVTILRSQYTPNIMKEFDIVVLHAKKEPIENPPIRMEVGIEDSLHIEFEYVRSSFHLRDVVIGKIYFLLVCIPVSTVGGKKMRVGEKRAELARFTEQDGYPERFG